MSKASGPASESWLEVSVILNKGGVGEGVVVVCARSRDICPELGEFWRVVRVSYVTYFQRDYYCSCEQE
jgi:hypothetical protein